MLILFRQGFVKDGMYIYQCIICLTLFSVLCDAVDIQKQTIYFTACIDGTATFNTSYQPANYVGVSWTFINGTANETTFANSTNLNPGEIRFLNETYSKRFSLLSVNGIGFWLSGIQRADAGTYRSIVVFANGDRDIVTWVMERSDCVDLYYSICTIALSMDVETVLISCVAYFLYGCVCDKEHRESNLILVFILNAVQFVIGLGFTITISLIADNVSNVALKDASIAFSVIAMVMGLASCLHFLVATYKRQKRQEKNRLEFQKRIHDKVELLQVPEPTTSQGINNNSNARTTSPDVNEEKNDEEMEEATSSTKDMDPEDKPMTKSSIQIEVYGVPGETQPEVEDSVHQSDETSNK